MEYQHELIIPSEGLPFKMFLFEGGEGHYVREKHWHRSIEIFAVFQGDIDFFINENRYHLSPGEFVLLNSNEIHSVLAPNQNSTVVLQIPLKAFEPYFTEEQYIHFTHSPRTQDEKVMELIGEMYDTYTGKKTGYGLKVLSQYYMLMYMLVTKYRKEEVDKELLHHSRQLNKLSVITTYIQDNYNQEISLEELAAVFGYSQAYLSRMFKKYVRTNYKTYLQNVRLEYARKDLLNTDDTISRIAENHGFANCKSFTKYYREKYGILPSEVRKKK